MDLCLDVLLYVSEYQAKNHHMTTHGFFLNLSEIFRQAIRLLFICYWSLQDKLSNLPQKGIARDSLLMLL